jgi:hypothetical protein
MVGSAVVSWLEIGCWQLLATPCWVAESGAGAQAEIQIGRKTWNRAPGCGEAGWSTGLKLELFQFDDLDIALALRGWLET